MTDKETKKKPDPEQAAPEPEETETAGGQPEEQAEPAEEAAGEDNEPTEPTEPAEPAGTQDDSARRIALLEEQLLQARCRLAAYAAGVSPELAEDAVTLAIGAARQEGEVTEETVTRAMDGVLKRHPDWKNGRAMAGFRLGADTDPNLIPAPGGEPEPEKRRWNRFK